MDVREMKGQGKKGAKPKGNDKAKGKDKKGQGKGEGKGYQWNLPKKKWRSRRQAVRRFSGSQVKRCRRCGGFSLFETVCQTGRVSAIEVDTFNRHGQKMIWRHGTLAGMTVTKTGLWMLCMMEFDISGVFMWWIMAWQFLRWQWGLVFVSGTTTELSGPVCRIWH